MNEKRREKSTFFYQSKPLASSTFGPNYHPLQVK